MSKLNIFLQEKRCISTHIVVFLLEMSLVSLTWSGKIMHSSITALCPQCNSQNQSYFKTSWKLQKSKLFSSRSYQTCTTHLSDLSKAQAFAVSSQQFQTQIASRQRFWAPSILYRKLWWGQAQRAIFRKSLFVPQEMDTVEFTGLFLKFRELTMIKDRNGHFHLAHERSEIKKKRCL